MTLETHLYKLQDVSYDFDYCSKFVKSKIVKYVPLNVFLYGNYKHIYRDCPSS